MFELRSWNVLCCNRRPFLVDMCRLRRGTVFGGGSKCLYCVHCGDLPIDVRISELQRVLRGRILRGECALLL